MDAIAELIQPQKRNNRNSYRMHKKTMLPWGFYGRLYALTDQRLFTYPYGWCWAPTGPVSDRMAPVV
jgi:hypothetical protein